MIVSLKLLIFKIFFQNYLYFQIEDFENEFSGNNSLNYN